ncbi:VRR-NUC domain-containing protein [Halioglobus maricola]|uniref:phosphodiesterase I n=1 Tax=Halioglobus maricola TaxID=2601894 RepID=A0A5P9NP25_9GAMM|nr:VRR-NUC domain-containing protein [Halioglobus maricola]QFU77542.1 VRR-NUC domain-containing protein [Halioglobus maricola]
MATPPSVDLAPHYYRDNFQRLLDTVDACYSDLLAPAELELLSTYRALGFAAQCLYVRLVSRVGPWFREANLDYPELGDLAQAIDELLAAGLMAEAASSAEIANLFTRPELAAALGLSASKSKAELLAAAEEQAPLDLEGMGEGRIVGPLCKEEVEIFSLLFFGNRHQGLTDFVLSDLGVARHYPYALDRSQRLFPDRAALEEYLVCAAIADSWWALREGGGGEIDLSTLAELALEFVPQYASTSRRYSRLCNSLARELERAGEGDLALALYQRSDLHPARERSARIFERAGKYDEAISLCETILAEPWGEEERDAAGRIMPRLQRAVHGTRQARVRDSFAEVQLNLERGEASVERLAAQALEAEWREVHYVENSLMNGLFGLAFWEQIFAPVPGAFHNPFQAVPADMYDQGFALRRERHLAARFAALQSDLAGEVRAAWRRCEGYQCRWINWRSLDEALVDRAVEIIPAQHLLAIWERMLFDPGENRRGFPDLIALGESPGDYSMIEVKGPGDALQHSQKRWLRFFGAQQIPAQVAWVKWRDD